jgi:hypothetical protein
MTRLPFGQGVKLQANRFRRDSHWSDVPTIRRAPRFIPRPCARAEGGVALPAAPDLPPPTAY